MKRAAEALLTTVGIDRLARHSLRRRTLVLAYHNVIPAGERPCGERSLHLGQAAFAEQLDALGETHDIVPLSAIDNEPSGDRPRAILTFDDAYRGAIMVGLPEIERRGFPATIFVAPGLFETFTWWDRLADAHGGVLPSELRNAALSRGRGRADDVDAIAGRGSASLPEWAAIAAEDEVLNVATSPRVTLGAHTWTHANLSALEADEIAGEFTRSIRWLRSKSPNATPWLAYPYGLTNSIIAVGAETAGHAGAFRVDGGWLPAKTEDAALRYDLPRMNVPSNMSFAGFRLRASGVLTR